MYGGASGNSSPLGRPHNQDYTIAQGGGVHFAPSFGNYQVYTLYIHICVYICCGLRTNHNP